MNSSLKTILKVYIYSPLKLLMKEIKFVGLSFSFNHTIYIMRIYGGEVWSVEALISYSPTFLPKYPTLPTCHTLPTLPTFHTLPTLPTCHTLPTLPTCHTLSES